MDWALCQLVSSLKQLCNENETQILTCPRSQSQYVGMLDIYPVDCQTFYQNTILPLTLQTIYEMLSHFVQPWITCAGLLWKKNFCGFTSFSL